MWRAPDSGWTFYYKEKLAQYSGMSIEEFNETTLNSKDQWVVADMVATKGEYSFVEVKVQKLSQFFASIYDVSIVHGEIWLESLENKLKNQFDDDIVITPTFVTKMGVDYYATDYSCVLNGTVYYVRNIYVLDNLYLYSISFSTSNKDEIQTLTDNLGIFQS